jgi:hypothetical protein
VILDSLAIKVEQDFKEPLAHKGDQVFKAQQELLVAPVKLAVGVPLVRLVRRVHKDQPAELGFKER